MNQPTVRVTALILALAFGCAARAQNPPMSHAETVKKATQMIDEGKKQKGDGRPPACSLLQRTDVQKATGSDPRESGIETPFPPGTTCELGPARLYIFASPTAWKDYEAMLKAERRDKHPRKDVAGIGDRAFVMLLKAENPYQRDTALLATQVGQNLLQLSLYAPKGKPAESVQGALTDLATAVVAKLRE